ncbi:hypothetical protein [uncultured Bradyrhizobium sp.]|uniref:hypothetical protein n=1 Tax=uncultured Bradyrhizobium sp. TaxID=199684 RepID=UPI002628E342|nr:hypothetical protein [uncultured Bradyrhizobium sp.]
MTSKRQIEANCRNAKRSTGPKTAAGKQSASQNAFRHGLSRAGHQPEDELDSIAQALVANLPDAESHEQARSLVACKLQLIEIRAVRAQLLAAAMQNPTERRFASVLKLERYERAALAMRRRILQQACARTGPKNGST